jgi:hypothetical protein
MNFYFPLRSAAVGCRNYHSVAMFHFHLQMQKVRSLNVNFQLKFKPLVGYQIALSSFVSYQLRYSSVVIQNTGKYQ